MNSNLLEIMDKESCSKSEVYLYKEEGRWYAYERSAFYLNQMIPGLFIGRYVMEDTLWLAKAEVDVSQLPRENIVSCSKTEYVLHYTPHNGFHEWLAEIE